MTLSTWLKQGLDITIAHIPPASIYPFTTSNPQDRFDTQVKILYGYEFTPNINYMPTVDPCYLRHTYYRISASVPGRCPVEQTSAFPFNYRDTRYRATTNNKRISKLKQEISRQPRSGSTVSNTHVTFGEFVQLGSLACRSKQPGTGTKNSEQESLGTRLGESVPEKSRLDEYHIL